MKKRKIELNLDFLRCPILESNIDTGMICTDIKIIDDDSMVKELNYKIGNIYSDYYEFDSHDLPCWFNMEKAKSDKRMLLDLTKKLVNRLNEINDGSYEVVDKITEYLNRILK